MAASSIEWTHCTWNPVTGCDKISPGCKHCYAERQALRLRAMGLAKYSRGFEVALHPDALGRPLLWRSPRLVFVNSMSDLFHEEVPFSFVDRVWAVMALCPRHRFQLLTKRPERARDYLNRFIGHHCDEAIEAVGAAAAALATDRAAEQIASGMDTPLENAWLGTSIESSRYLGRADVLRDTAAQVRFLSLEPLLGPLPGLDLSGIDWVIAGGESGPSARPMDPAWARGIRDSCVARGVPFFFKQWGGPSKKRAGRVLDGRTWDEMPRRATQHRPTLDSPARGA